MACGGLRPDVHAGCLGCRRTLRRQLDYEHGLRSARTDAHLQVGVPQRHQGQNFHGQHNEPGDPGYLLIEGKIADDGNAKLSAKGTVSHSGAHGIFAMKGNNYSYTIKAEFTDAKGTGTRNEGAGVLGRPCSFEFTKQPDTPAAPQQPPAPQQ